MKRKGLGTNPLDAVIPTTTTNGTHEPKATKEKGKARCTYHISVEVAEKARDAAWWTPGLTLAALVEKGMAAEIARLEAERGEPFPPRQSELARGFRS